MYVFWPIQATIMVREPLCDLETPSWGKTPYLGLFYEYKVIGYLQYVIAIGDTC